MRKERNIWEESLERKNSKTVRDLSYMVALFYARPEIVIDTDSYFYD